MNLGKLASALSKTATYMRDAHALQDSIQTGDTKPLRKRLVRRGLYMIMGKLMSSVVRRNGL